MPVRTHTTHPFRALLEREREVVHSRPSLSPVKSQGSTSSSPQGTRRTVDTPTQPKLHHAGGDAVSTYEVTLKDRTVEVIEGADAYQQEGQMTTFFSTAAGRQVVDCWSSRVASFRTTEVVIIRRVERVLPRVVGIERSA